MFDAKIYYKNLVQNPVLGMLFYTKHGDVEVKTEEDLKEIAPAKLYEEQLFVLCRLESKISDN